ncbi:MAG TPA: hypothetical protein VI756_14165 [Blastocatellia bacterium]
MARKKELSPEKQSGLTKAKDSLTNPNVKGDRDMNESMKDKLRTTEIELGIYDRKIDELQTRLTEVRSFVDDIRAMEDPKEQLIAVGRLRERQDSIERELVAVNEGTATLKQQQARLTSEIDLQRGQISQVVQ